MLIVGLTGGVASGKTAVSEVLREEGAYIIDADQIARELVQPHKPAWNEIIRAFGKEILQEDRSVDRKELADKIFADPEQRKVLNQILHPRIKEEIARRAREIGQKNPEAIVVIDAPLLVELGMHHKVDRLIVVTSTQTQQMERLKKRDGRSPEEALRLLSSQMPVEEKEKLADFVVRNEGSLEEMKKRAKEVFKELKRGMLQKNKKQ
ncbi:MAG: dephospho-CoA kinase [Thermodesulfobacteriota bacterium]|jgi:dephospho-CoA kinase